MTLVGVRSKPLQTEEIIYRARTFGIPTLLPQDDIYYKSITLPKYFIFNNNTGDIKITKDIFQHVNNKDVFTINIGASDVQYPKRNASFQMTIIIKLINAESINCEKFFNYLCFWTDVKYQVLENQPSSFLGILSPLYYKNLCKNYTVTYDILKGPNKSKLKIEQQQFSKSWYLWTNTYLDRDVEHEANFNVTIECEINGTISKPLTLRKNVNIQVLDEDDSPLVPQVPPVVEVCLSSREVKKVQIHIKFSFPYVSFR